MYGIHAKKRKKNPRFSVVVRPCLLAAGFPGAIVEDQIIEIANRIPIRHSDITLLSF